MRIKLTYTHKGSSVQDLAEVNNFPTQSWQWRVGSLLSKTPPPPPAKWTMGKTAPPAQTVMSAQTGTPRWPGGNRIPSDTIWWLWWCVWRLAQQKYLTTYPFSKCDRCQCRPRCPLHLSTTDAGKHMLLPGRHAEPGAASYQQFLC